jgi:DNA-directed RNA polymerase sigma subunit (sigma70/sigma32)
MRSGAAIAAREFGTTISAGRWTVADLEDWEVDALAEREQVVLRLRFGLWPMRRRHTNSEIGDLIGVRAERVRQLQVLAILNLLAHRAARTPTPVVETRFGG